MPRQTAHPRHWVRSDLSPANNLGLALPLESPQSAGGLFPTKGRFGFQPARTPRCALPACGRGLLGGWAPCKPAPSEPRAGRAARATRPARAAAGPPAPRPTEGPTHTSRQTDSEGISSPGPQSLSYQSPPPQRLDLFPNSEHKGSLMRPLNNAAPIQGGKPDRAPWPEPGPKCPRRRDRFPRSRDGARRRVSARRGCGE